jgi:ABC-type transport system substrate-binding protein
MTLFFAADRTPPRGRNINFLENAELTDLLYRSDRTVDLAERRRLLHEAQKLIAELIPEIPLYNVTRLDVVPDRLQNFKGNPTNSGIFWNAHEWEIR